LLAPLGACEGWSDGEGAVAAAQKALAEGRPYDLVCLDIQLGKMDGQAALKAIRAAELSHGRSYGHGARVIMTTARADTRNVSSAFTGMCDAYLVKPVTPAKLQATLQELGVPFGPPSVRSSEPARSGRAPQAITPGPPSSASRPPTSAPRSAPRAGPGSARRP
jgi:two-component system chemotaxis response regulator CheY